MRRHKWRGLHRGATWSIALITLSVTTIGAFLRADLEKTNWGFIEPAVRWSQMHAGYLIPGLSLLGGILALIVRHLGPPWVWETVHEVLDDLRERVFGDRAGELHHHRATLFKHQKYCWQRIWKWRERGWLVPVERSGHTTQKSSVIFLAPDDADRAQGIAGLAWASQGTVEVHDLPDLSGNPREEDIQEYATNTKVTADWLKKERPLARSLSGFPVEAQGKRWGVIVLDSRSPTAITDELQSYRVVGRFLGRLLRRI